ncbi:MAG: lysylphosphatidylglycerol synthase transmembrane domain-containing protein, partial [Endomicrobiales bacterium]
IALAVLVYSSAFALRAVRWKYLLAPLKVFPAVRLFSYLILGFFMNNVLPLRLGEIIRAHITGQKVGIPRTSALATIVVERLFDGLSYICLFLVTVLFMEFPGSTKKAFLSASVLFLAGMVFLFFLVRHKQPAIRLFNKLPLPRKFQERIQSMFANFLGGLGIFGHGLGLVRILILSLTVWTIEGTVFLIMGQAFHMDLSLFQCFFVMIIIGTGAILPTAPGYVGTVEFLGVTALSFMGINKNQAFGYIITLHLLQLTTIAFWGIRSLVIEKITFSELVRIEKQR